jgi:hypothetical protein
VKNISCSCYTLLIVVVNLSIVAVLYQLAYVSLVHCFIEALISFLYLKLPYIFLLSCSRQVHFIFYTCFIPLRHKLCDIFDLSDQ